MKEDPKMKKFKRIGAIVVIVLLLSMYIICLIAALSGSEQAQTLFRTALGMTVAVPIVLYAFLMMLRLAEGKKEEPLPDEGKKDEENGPDSPEEK